MIFDAAEAEGPRGARLGIVDARRSGRRLHLPSADVPDAGGDVHGACRVWISTALGIPTEEEYVAAYCRRTGRDHLPNLDYLIVFMLFRLAGILHGIRGRLARGNASSAHAEATAALTEPLAELAWAEAQKARL